MVSQVHHKCDMKLYEFSFDVTNLLLTYTIVKGLSQGFYHYTFNMKLKLYTN